MRILALITARSQSKRLPGKNIKLIGGKPLITWSIDIAKNISEVCDILVSTDDPITAKISKDAGASVPWLRPKNLATDTSNSVDVALHALDWFETQKGAVDGILLLQPTSPFRTLESVRRGINLFKKNRYQSIVAISKTDSHPMWTLKIEKNYLVPFMKDNGLGIRSQDLPPAYVVNGSFYLISPFELRTHKSFFGTKTLPLLIESPKEGLDIDTEWDFKIAEFIMANLHEN